MVLTPPGPLSHHMWHPGATGLQPALTQEYSSNGIDFTSQTWPITSRITRNESLSYYFLHMYYTWVSPTELPPPTLHKISTKSPKKWEKIIKVTLCSLAFSLLIEKMVDLFRGNPNISTQTSSNEQIKKIKLCGIILPE